MTPELIADAAEHMRLTLNAIDAAETLRVVIDDASVTEIVETEIIARLDLLARALCAGLGIRIETTAPRPPRKRAITTNIKRS